MSPTEMLTDQSSIQHSLDPESKITLGNLSPGRISPNNLFMGINLDHFGMDRNTLALEWSTFTPSASTSSSTSSFQALGRSLSTIDETPNCLHLDVNAPSVTYDEIKFLNVDQFNMENFKSDCTLNLDPTILDDHASKVHNHHHHHMGLDLHNFNMSDCDKSSPLMDLEKPIMNITVDNLTSDKY